MLDYELAQVLAEELAEEPKLGRPTESEVNTLNALLPGGFFNYQDQLVERAAVLKSAAAKRHDQELIAAFSSLAETCVGCHAAYLYEDDEAPGDQEPWLHDSAP